LLPGRAWGNSETEYQPYHSHDEIWLLSPNEVIPLEIEIWPTCMIFEAGHRLVLDIDAHDGSGSSIWQHTDPDDRGLATFAGTNILYTGSDRPSSLLLPLISTEG
jgi:predicted acyl esterase